MFTVLPTNRNSSLYLIAALAIMAVILLTFTIPSAIPAPRPIVLSAPGRSEASSDYFQRHPESSVPGVGVGHGSDEFYLRYVARTASGQSIAIPVTGILEGSDYIQRHTALRMPAEIVVDSTDYFTRHPELRTTAPMPDLSDYALRH